MKNYPAPVQLWAIVVISKRSEWINYSTVARTKSDAWKKYGEYWIPSAFAKHRRLGRARKPGGVYATRVEVTAL